MAQTLKNHLQCGRPEFDPWVRETPWRRAWQPTPVLLPGVSSRTEEPSGLQSIESQRVRHNWATEHRIIRETKRKTETERKESVGNPRVLSYLSISPTPNSLLPSYMNGACGHSFFFFFNWKYLVYNVVLVSSIQSDSFTYIYIYIFFFFSGSFPL